MCRWLVGEAGLPVDARTKDGSSALHLAAWQGHLDVCQWLVAEAGADAHARNNYGCNAVIWAAQGGKLAVWEWLRTLVCRVHSLVCWYARAHIDASAAQPVREWG